MRSALRLALFALLFGPLLALLPDEFAARLTEKMAQYARQRPTEKVYLHLDRATYLPGETVWLKGYLFDGSTHRPDSISGLLYVELLSADTRRRVQTVPLRATNGHAPGQIALPDTLRPGPYVVRAYTNYMRNFSDEYFFQQPITVLPYDVAGTAVPTGLDVQFMPEGGPLIAGLNSRIAFKATNGAGAGTAVEGFVLDAKKDTVAGLRTTWLGMGFFALKPDAGGGAAPRQYVAFARPVGSRDYVRFPLPNVAPGGLSLTVDNLSDTSAVRVYVVHSPAPAPAVASTKFTLLAQTRGQVIQVAEGPLTRRATLVKLPKAQFPEGITQLTLFDDKERPVAERLVFIDRRERLTLRITPTKTTYAPRERVDMDVAVTNAAGRPAPATLSVAVTDAELVPTASDATLPSYLLLGSDLRGAVEQSAYYFDERNGDRAEKLDLLLMTQGWRKFTWADVLAETVPAPQFYPETGMTLRGKVLRPNGKPASAVNLMLMFNRPDSSRAVAQGEVQPDGRFVLGGLDMEDTTKVLFQATTAKGSSDLNVSLDPWLWPAVTLTRPPLNPVQVAAADWAAYQKKMADYANIERQLRRNRETVQLDEVAVRAKKNVPKDTRRLMYNPSGATNVPFTSANTNGAFTIFDVLRSRVAGLSITGGTANPVVQIRGASNMTSGVVEPLFLLDGTPVTKDAILTISVNDVEGIDVLKSASVAIQYGSRAAGGVINVLTKRGNINYDFSKDKTPGTLAARLRGFAAVREFYAPRYDQPQPTNRPDERATLHWQPMLQTDSLGRARLTFWTSDARTTLNVVAQGTTATGQPGHGTVALSVK